jgi:four helix bundle protein
MPPAELQLRVARQALHIFQHWRPHLRSPETRDVAQQVIRSSASTAANYRAARLSRSRVEFIAKLGLVREEADETVFWLEFAEAGQLASGEHSAALLKESREISAIFSAAYRTARKVGKW